MTTTINTHFTSGASGILTATDVNRVYHSQRKILHLGRFTGIRQRLCTAHDKAHDKEI